MALKNGAMQGFKTPQQVKEELRKKGKPITELAAELGFEYATVRAVINGMNKGDRGNAHKVAVALGIKEAA